MHRLLFTSTATLALAAGTAASAQTVIDTKRTTPVRTATVNNGAAADIRIAATGSVVTTGRGTAVTLDSNNTLANAGTIQTTDANDAIGIGAAAGVTGDIANTGKIILDETYTPTDIDKDGDLDGPFAQGARRTGIRTAGRFTGNIANSGEITIEGNDSAGISLNGPLTGNLTQSGKINVLGDRSVGVATAAVSGNVTLGGTIVAVGEGAVGARVDGDIGGALSIEGGIGATGYRYTTPPANGSKLDPDDLLQGRSALVVGGNVAGGIVLQAWQDRSQPYAVETAAGETRILALPDGSAITLAGASRIALDRTDPRRARLERGEALFRVKHDALHPFAVQAGGVALVDLGTVFDVRLGQRQTRVAVAEGAVMVDPQGAALRLDAGQAVIVGDGHMTRSAVEPENVGGWRDGRLVFDDAPLRDVAEDLSRFLRQPVTVAPAIAARRFRGVIDLEAVRRDPALLGSLMEVRVRSGAAGWTLEPRG